MLEEHDMADLLEALVAEEIDLEAFAKYAMRWKDSIVEGCACIHAWILNRVNEGRGVAAGSWWL